MYKEILYSATLCVLMAAPNTVFSAEWHVSPAATQTGNGSPSNPFLSLTTARGAVRDARQSRDVQEPDTIWLHPGEYRLDSTFELTHEDRGTADCPIIWKATEPNRVILSGREVSVLISIYDAEHLRVEGMQLTGAVDQAIEIAHCQNVSLIGCQVSEIGHTGLHIFGGRNCEIQDCRLTQCDEHGIRVEAGNNETLEPANHVIHGCHFSSCGVGSSIHGSAIHVSGVACEVSGNRIVNCENSGICIDGNNHRVFENHLENVCLAASNVSAIYLNLQPTERGNTIERNAILHVGKTPRLDAIAIFLNGSPAETIVRHNIVSAAGRGIAVAGGGGNDISDNLLEDCIISIQLENRQADDSIGVTAENTRIERNLLQRSGGLAVDSIDTFRANHIDGNRRGDKLFLLSQTDPSIHGVQFASAANGDSSVTLKATMLESSVDNRMRP